MAAYPDDDYTDIGDNFEYDAFGRSSSTKVGAQPLSSYAYNNTSGNLTRTTYGNGQCVEPVCDNLDRVRQLKYNGTV